MNIQLALDYQTILRNESRPVHLVAKLTAHKLETHARPRSAAFAVVLDRSASMSGQPLELAPNPAPPLSAICVGNDFFSLVVFDDSAQVVIPLQKPTDRHGMMTLIRLINSRPSWLMKCGD
jgi:Ca-activated chloride channel family protein